MTTERLTGEVMVFQPITILEITAAGVRFEAPLALQNDSLHEFRLTLDARPIIVKGRVVGCEAGELRDGVVLYRCLMEFVEPSPHAVDAIADFVTFHKAPPSQRVIDGQVS